MKRIIANECYECSSMDTIIENGQMKCNICSGCFTHKGGTNGKNTNTC